MKNFVQTGEVITVTAPAAVVSGQGLLIGALFGVVCAAAAAGADAEMRTVGVFDLPAAAADVVAVGAKVYWDNAAKNVTTVSASNTLIGVAVTAKSASVTVIRVRLNGTV